MNLPSAGGQPQGAVPTAEGPERDHCQPGWCPSWCQRCSAHARSAGPGGLSVPTYWLRLDNTG